jgi:NADH-quinone oxidoreductase subunit G/[NiFe] hydrogenase diaphorase moiety small subunit/NADP-reducing hydrogenase subunit HndD
VKQHLPSIIVTGASGFIGRHLLETIKDQFIVYAIARRSAKEANQTPHPNIHWIQWDIGSKGQIEEVIRKIQVQGGADYLIHLAAFYNFDYTDNSAYQITNVTGTRNIIEVARQIRIKRFIFASSLAACVFPKDGGRVNESSPPDADFAYARTKKAGEEMLLESIRDFSVSIVRFAAVFSDWCEYPPLYKFLNTWLSDGYDSRILGGKGESAVSYIHINDLIRVVLNIIQKHHQLPVYDIYAASPDGCSSHKTLFELATRDFFGEPVKPIHIPKLIAYPGIFFRILLWKAGLTPQPFERYWMLKYLDLKLNVDSSYTRQALNWAPSTRYMIERRLIYLLSRMKSNPVEWHARNEAALKHISFRINLVIYETMMAHKETILKEIMHRMMKHENADRFVHYQQLDFSELKIIVNILFDVLAASVQNADRSLMINYINDIAEARFRSGYEVKEITGTFRLFNETLLNMLLKVPGHRYSKQELYDYISLSLQLAEDEIEEKFEWFLGKKILEEERDLVKLSIDGIEVKVEHGTSVLDAARELNIHIPTLCYHKDLKIAGNCRVCLVEVKGSKQLLASCATPAENGMEIFTNSLKVRTARRTMIELLLSEHNAECTNCYKNGKCELQFLASEFKIINPSFIHLLGETKHTPDVFSPAIIKDDSKCIRCQRCVRTCSELQGVGAVGVANKGSHTKISTYFGKPLFEVICTNCGQCIDRCPTGALVERNYIEEVWNAIWDPAKYVIVQTAPAVRIAIGEDLGFDPGKRLTGKLVSALRRLGFDAVLDTAFSADLTTVEEGAELLSRLRRKYGDRDNQVRLPMTTSCSPGWIKYMEHLFPEFIEHVSTCKSPQQMFGVLAKTYYAQKNDISPDRIVTVSVMPCTAKKFEADRPEMRASGCKDVDYVLTTRELAIMINQAGIDIKTLPNDHYDSLMGKATGAGVIFGATGGVMEATLRTVYERMTGREIPFENLVVTSVRGMEGCREMHLEISGTLPEWSFLEGKTLNLMVAHGLANAKQVMQQVREDRERYHFIEIMACPGGCLGGGGQPIPTNPEIRMKRVQALYAEDLGLEIRKAHENPEIRELYESFLGYPMSEKAHELLHTRYISRIVY